VIASPADNSCRYQPPQQSELQRQLRSPSPIRKRGDGPGSRGRAKAAHPARKMVLSLVPQQSPSLGLIGRGASAPSSGPSPNLRCMDAALLPQQQLGILTFPSTACPIFLSHPSPSPRRLPSPPLKRCWPGRRSSVVCCFSRWAVAPRSRCIPTHACCVHVRCETIAHHPALLL
jgi:hypothetical protein